MRDDFGPDERHDPYLIELLKDCKDEYDELGVKKKYYKGQYREKVREVRRLDIDLRAIQDGFDEIKESQAVLKNARENLFPEQIAKHRRERDRYNAEVRIYIGDAREFRNQRHELKHEADERMDILRTKRSDLNKRRRTLSERLRNVRTDFINSRQEDTVRGLKREIRDLEYKIQTDANIDHKAATKNVEEKSAQLKGLLHDDEVKDRRKELKYELQMAQEESDALDQEHAEIQELYRMSNVFGERYARTEEKIQEYKALADEQHQKLMEVRENVKLSWKRSHELSQQWDEYKAARKEIRKKQDRANTKAQRYYALWREHESLLKGYVRTHQQQVLDIQREKMNEKFQGDVITAMPTTHEQQDIAIDTLKKGGKIEL